MVQSAGRAGTGQGELQAPDGMQLTLFTAE
jgi:hypothetical protein